MLVFIITVVEYLYDVGTYYAATITHILAVFLLIVISISIIINITNSDKNYYYLKKLTKILTVVATIIILIGVIEYWSVDLFNRSFISWVISLFYYVVRVISIFFLVGWGWKHIDDCLLKNKGSFIEAVKIEIGMIDIPLSDTLIED